MLRTNREAHRTRVLSPRETLRGKGLGNQALRRSRGPPRSSSQALRRSRGPPRSSSQALRRSRGLPRSSSQALRGSRGPPRSSSQALRSRDDRPKPRPKPFAVPAPPAPRPEPLRRSTTAPESAPAPSPSESEDCRRVPAPESRDGWRSVPVPALRELQPPPHLVPSPCSSERIVLVEALRSSTWRLLPQALRSSRSSRRPALPVSRTRRLRLSPSNSTPRPRPQALASRTARPATQALRILPEGRCTCTTSRARRVGASSAQRRNLVSLSGHDDRMLPLRRQAAVGGHDCPAVVEETDRRAAEVRHGLEVIAMPRFRRAPVPRRP